MKYLKMLGLVVVAAMALVALVGAGTASATVLCQEANTTGCLAAGKEYPAGTTLEASLVGGTALLERQRPDGTWEVIVTCTGSTLRAQSGNRGGASEAVSGNVNTLSWTGCTKTIATVTLGELEIHYIAGTDNGTLTLKNTEVTVNTIFGSCFFGPGAGGSIDLGTLVGSATTPRIVIGANIPLLKGFCVQSIYRLTAEYHFTNPSDTFVSEK